MELKNLFSKDYNFDFEGFSKKVKAITSTNISEISNVDETSITIDGLLIDTSDIKTLLNLNSEDLTFFSNINSMVLESIVFDDENICLLLDNYYSVMNFSNLSLNKYTKHVNNHILDKKFYDYNFPFLNFDTIDLNYFSNYIKSNSFYSSWKTIDYSSSYTFQELKSSFIGEFDLRLTDISIYQSKEEYQLNLSSYEKIKKELIATGDESMLVFIISGKFFEYDDDDYTYDPTFVHPSASFEEKLFNENLLPFDKILSKETLFYLSKIPKDIYLKFSKEISFIERIYFIDWELFSIDELNEFIKLEPSKLDELDNVYRNAEHLYEYKLSDIYHSDNTTIFTNSFLLDKLNSPFFYKNIFILNPSIIDISKDIYITCLYNNFCDFKDKGYSSFKFDYHMSEIVDSIFVDEFLLFLNSKNISKLDGLSFFKDIMHRHSEIDMPFTDVTESYICKLFNDISMDNETLLFLEKASSDKSKWSLEEIFEYHSYNINVKDKGDKYLYYLIFLELDLYSSNINWNSIFFYEHLDLSDKFVREQFFKLLSLGFFDYNFKILFKLCILDKPFLEETVKYYKKQRNDFILFKLYLLINSKE